MAAMWKDEVTIRSAWDTLKSIAAQALPPNKEKPKRASIKSFISLANISDVQSEAKKELKQGQKRIYEREACDYSSKADGESENCIIDEAKVSSGKSLGGEQESYYSYTDSSQSIEDGERDGDDRWRLIGRKEVGKLADMCSEEEAKLVIYDGEEEAEPGNELKLAASQAYKLRPASPQLTPKLVNQDSKAREASGESAPRMRVDVPAFERMLTHHLGRRRASDPPAPRPTNSDEPASPVPENKVKCRRCTFLFPADKAQCGVCWAPADYREPEFWACDKCGYKKNEAVFDSCDVCGN